MSRRFLASLIASLLLDASALAADWPNFRGNPLQTGVAASSLPEQLEVRWKFQAKEGFEGAAAVVGDAVYLACLDGFLYAVDLNTGKEKWRYKGGPFKAAPGVKDGVVYAGDMDGIFHCVEAATGKKRWTFDTGSGSEVTSGANFAGANVLFGCGDENLYCLSREGKLVWKFKVPGGPVTGSPAVVGQRTFAAGCDSALHTLDVTNGKEVAGAVDLGGQVGATLAVRGDHLYVGTMTNQVFAVNWKKAEVAWKFEPAARAKPFFASVAVTEELVIAGCRNKRVYALNRKTGIKAWSFLTGDDVESSPVVAGDRVFVGSRDGTLHVLDLAKGTKLKDFNLGGQIVASPAVGGNCLVLGLANKGIVYCFGAKP
jgi:outer membrane protein assembly factor BamB